MTERTIVLMGLRGCGKSTVGTILAREVGASFIDLDDRTLALLREERGVSTIGEAFEKFGEAAFREAEARALRAVLHESESGCSVIALGGGTPTAPGAEAELKQSEAALVYLRLPPEVLTQRLRGKIDANRPALMPGSDAIVEIGRVHEQRDPLYRSLAQIVIEEDLGPEAMAERILVEVERLG